MCAADQPEEFERFEKDNRGWIIEFICKYLRCDWPTAEEVFQEVLKSLLNSKKFLDLLGTDGKSIRRALRVVRWRALDEARKRSRRPELLSGENSFDELKDRRRPNWINASPHEQLEQKERETRRQSAIYMALRDFVSYCEEPSRRGTRGRLCDLAIFELFVVHGWSATTVAARLAVDVDPSTDVQPRDVVHERTRSCRERVIDFLRRYDPRRSLFASRYDRRERNEAAAETHHAPAAKPRLRSDHHITESALLDYIDERLSEDDRSTFRAHLKRCDGCKGLLENRLQLDGLLRDDLQTDGLLGALCPSTVRLQRLAEREIDSAEELTQLRIHILEAADVDDLAPEAHKWLADGWVPGCLECQAYLTRHGTDPTRFDDLFA